MDDLEKHQRISLFVREHGEADERETEYVVRIVEITDLTFITEIPLDAKGYIRVLLPGDQVRVGFARGGAYFTFSSTVVQVLHEQVPLLELEKPSPEQIKKIQRRQYFRVPVMLQAELQKMSAGEASRKITEEEHRTRLEDQPTMRVTLVDLSGGGFALRHAERLLEPGQRVRGRIVLPLRKGDETVVFQAETRRVAQEGTTGLYLISLEFIDMTEKSRDLILRYCFQCQLEMRRRLSNAKD